MLPKTLKRFYKDSSPRPEEDGFAVLLDGRSIKTPCARPMVVPTLALAEAMAEEWNAQGEQVLPSSMPMTQLAGTALDRVGPERVHMTEQLMKFAGTDLLCYRAETPADLVARQNATWQPVLDWAAVELGARLETTTGLAALAQPPASLAALEACIDGYDFWRLTALQSACVAMGSLVLALALAKGRLDADSAYEASQLDETYQIELWGEDWEAADRRAALKADIQAAGRFLSLLSPS